MPGAAASTSTSLYISQPDTGEQALEIAEALIRSGAIDVVVIDSVAALVPRAEIEGEMGDSHVGLQARLMSQALRKLVGAIKTSNTSLDLHQPAPPEDRHHVRQPGDHVRRHGAQVLRQRPAGRAPHRGYQGGWQHGRQPHTGDGQEEQSGAPFPQAEFDIMYNKGISKSGDLLDLGTTMGIIDKRGAFYTFDDTRLGQGRENAKDFLEAQPAIVAADRGRHPREGRRLRRCSLPARMMTTKRTARSKRLAGGRAQSLRQRWMSSPIMV